MTSSSCEYVQLLKFVSADTIVKAAQDSTPIQQLVLSSWPVIPLREQELKKTFYEKLAKMLAGKSVTEYELPTIVKSNFEHFQITFSSINEQNRYINRVCHFLKTDCVSGGLQTKRCKVQT